MFTALTGSAMIGCLAPHATLGRSPRSIGAAAFAVLALAPGGAAASAWGAAGGSAAPPGVGPQAASSAARKRALGFGRWLNAPSLSARGARCREALLRARGCGRCPCEVRIRADGAAARRLAAP